ncbi:1,4-dihydroxy-2-naphthoate polyprenyltransferase [Bailinhaonella thermotolerans]|uniref:1,4-dihydroxy-2-naphthoate octaprenyltransferase n=1 Tax=Bailinhaonella thermotolerans TaxID=1070861 RepID=A0A3A4ADQ1_9ACTN|nr:1,4-dihydroxy-2-naphthoate polyprenyltransferase [Bailinhaonella thermotolerans]RJL26561.1 1,4-dihydroxy-2-naphthoate polyprenyltransferase [Bailinhaonella thermotolerans]
MATASQWVAGARPRTLPAAVVPVLVGTGVAFSYGGAVWWRALLALIVSLALQVGVNYANDYSDGVRGTDADRVGPMRLVGSGAAPARQVLAGALLSFAVALAAGLALVVATRAWWLLLVGAACVVAAWFYTGGDRPYGYRALGEVSVFVFFGLVAVAGTTYVQMESLPWLALAAAVPVGLIACAILVVNNLRDIVTDGPAGKRTLAVVLGAARTRALFTACVALPYVVALALAPARPWALLTLLSIPLAAGPVQTVRKGASGPALIAVLQQTGRLHLVYGALLTIGLAIA